MFCMKFRETELWIGVSRSSIFFSLILWRLILILQWVEGIIWFKCDFLLISVTKEQTEIYSVILIISHESH